MLFGKEYTLYICTNYQDFYIFHAIKKVTEDIEKRFNFNTAISSIMELVNDMYKYKEKKKVNPSPHLFSLRGVGLAGQLGQRAGYCPNSKGICHAGSDGESVLPVAG